MITFLNQSNKATSGKHLPIQPPLPRQEYILRSIDGKVHILILSNLINYILNFSFVILLLIVCMLQPLRLDCLILFSGGNSLCCAFDLSLCILCHFFHQHLLPLFACSPFMSLPFLPRLKQGSVHPFSYNGTSYRIFSFFSVLRVKFPGHQRRVLLITCPACNCLSQRLLSKFSLLSSKLLILGGFSKTFII